MKIFRDGNWYEQLYSDASILASLRYKLIEFLAGNSSVILNTSLVVEEREDERFAVKVSNIKSGFLCDSNKFDIPETLQIRFKQN